MGDVHFDAVLGLSVAEVSGFRVLAFRVEGFKGPLSYPATLTRLGFSLINSWFSYLGQTPAGA